MAKIGFIGFGPHGLRDGAAAARPGARPHGARQPRPRGPRRRRRAWRDRGRQRPRGGGGGGGRHALHGHLGACRGTDARRGRGDRGPRRRVRRGRLRHLPSVVGPRRWPRRWPRRAAPISTRPWAERRRMGARASSTSWAPATRPPSTMCGPSWTTWARTCSIWARSGSGHTIKLINNFFAMTTANAMSEAFAMADKAGIARPGPLRRHERGTAPFGDDGLHEGLRGGRRSAEAGLHDPERVQGRGLLQGGWQTTFKRLRSCRRCADEALRAAVEDGHGDGLVPTMVDVYAARFGTLTPCPRPSAISPSRGGTIRRPASCSC